jgi:hypothetical protein
MDGGGSFSFLTPKIFFIFFLFFFYREIEGFVDFDSVLAKPKQMKEGFFFFFFFCEDKEWETYSVVSKKERIWTFILIYFGGGDCVRSGLDRS